MLKINRLNKAKALPAVGVLSAAVSAALWAWMWHSRGLSVFDPGAEQAAALLAYLVSLATLSLFIGRLSGRRLVAAALVLTAANAILWIAGWLINQYYVQFFALTHPFPIQVCQRNNFINPVRNLVITGGIDNP